MTLEAIFRIKNKKGEAQEDIKMYQSLVFGRGKNANISITDDKISGVHCQITFKDDRMEIIDLDSKNGTYLNGIRVEHSEIFIGDELRIGGTFITFDPANMVPDAIELLTFPGRFKDRINYELKIDFTGARVQNQKYMKEHPNEINSAYQAKEIALRKKAHSRIRLSKQEVKSKNKFLSYLSSLIDLMILLILVFLPLMYINSLDGMGMINLANWQVSEETLAQNKTMVLSVLEIMTLCFFIFTKTKMKYSLGEKIAGIQDLHVKQ